jgi:AraC-like DNA-binding protein
LLIYATNLFFWAVFFFLPAPKAGALPAGQQAPLTARQLVSNLRTKSFTGEVMDLDFNRVEASRIFQRFEEISGLDFEFDAKETVGHKLTFKGVKWDKALYLVLTNLELDLKLGIDRLRVVCARPRSDSPPLSFLNGVFITVLLVLLGFSLLRSHRKRSKARRLEKKASLPEDRIEEIRKRVLYLFEVEKIYRQEILSLNALAERLEIRPHHLSWILNARIGKTFSDFLNQYRIEEVKKRLTDPGERDQTILDIAFGSGYNSKSAFNKTFKTFTGKTPSHFRSENGCRP